MRKTIVQKNLALLMNDGKGSLHDALRRSPESLGGNAGAYKRMSCFGANFHYDGNTGEILYFGNIEDVPITIKRNYLSGTLKITADQEYIVELIFPDEMGQAIDRMVGLGKISQEARRTLEETVQTWNECMDANKLIREVQRFATAEDVMVALKKVVGCM